MRWVDKIFSGLMVSGGIIGILDGLFLIKEVRLVFVSVMLTCVSLLNIINLYEIDTLKKPLTKE